MSTEQTPAAPTPATNQAPSNPTHNEPKAEPNALATGLSSAWTKFKAGQLIGYPMMALIIVVIAGISVGWWIMRERRGTEAAKWIERDGINTVTDLEKFAENNPNSIHAKLAKLEIARTHLGPEGIDRMGVRESDIRAASAEEAARQASETRKQGVANVEKAREEFATLVDEFKDDPVIRVECMLACAKAEAVLIGIPKEGKQVDPFVVGPLAPGDSRGDTAKAIEWLDKVAEAAPETPWGQDSKKLADALRDLNTKQQVATLQASLFDISPVIPKRDPRMPKDAVHGFPP